MIRDPEALGVIHDLLQRLQLARGFIPDNLSVGRGARLTVDDGIKKAQKILFESRDFLPESD